MVSEDSVPAMCSRIFNVAVFDNAISLVNDGDTFCCEGRLESLIAGHSEAALGFDYFVKRQL